MFVFSVRASTLKFFAVVGLCLTVLFAVLTISPETTVYASSDGKEINYGNIRSEEDRVNFIRQFGLEVKGGSEFSEKFAMPKNFDRIIAGYNQLQKEQGLDLSKYTRKKVTHYRYEVTNYNYENTVFVNLYIYRNKIVACDISSENIDGFVLPLINIDPKNLK